MPFFDSKTGSFSPLNIEKKWSIGWFIWRFFGPWIKNYREKSVDRVGIIEKNWSILKNYREKLVDSFCKLLIFYIYLPVDNGIPFPFLRYPFFSLYTLTRLYPSTFPQKWLLGFAFCGRYASRSHELTPTLRSPLAHYAPCSAWPFKMWSPQTSI